jgi:hypothetical protein
MGWIQVKWTTIRQYWHRWNKEHRSQVMWDSDR